MGVNGVGCEEGTSSRSTLMRWWLGVEGAGATAFPFPFVAGLRRLAGVDGPGSGRWCASSSCSSSSTLN